MLIGVKVREGAPILGKTLADVFREENDLRVAAIKRHNVTLIPAGKDMVQHGDLVYYIAKPSAVETIRVLSGKKSDDIKNVMFMGGSRIAIKTTQLLGNEFTLKMIEQNRTRIDWLTTCVNPDTMIIHGDGRDVELLEAEGIKEMDAFISLTDRKSVV